MKILIAIPCMDQVPAVFAQSLATLNRTGDVFVSMRIGSLIYDSRNNLAKDAVNMGADYVLWLDSDMTFPSDTIAKLMKLHEEKGENSIVSGLYFRRVEPFTPVLNDLLYIDEEDRPVFHNVEVIPAEPFEVEGCGFGCVFMPTQALVDVAVKFGDMFGPMKSVGEDLSFCIRAREAGYKIFCDPSVECGHVGHSIITRGFWESYKAVNRKVGE